MEETKRIAKLFADLYNGDSWIGENIIDTLQSLTAQQAARKFLPGWNSIWQITHHMVGWRSAVLQRIEGEITLSPNNNYFLPVEDQSENAWKAMVESMEKSQHDWLEALKDFNENDLEKVYDNNDMTFYENIHGIIQHDAYHLGQIIMLAKHS